MATIETLYSQIAATWEMTAQSQGVFGQSQIAVTMVMTPYLDPDHPETGLDEAKQQEIYWPVVLEELPGLVRVLSHDYADGKFTFTWELLDQTEIETVSVVFSIQPYTTVEAFSQGTQPETIGVFAAEAGVGEVEFDVGTDPLKLLIRVGIILEEYGYEESNRVYVGYVLKSFNDAERTDPDLSDLSTYLFECGTLVQVYVIGWDDHGRPTEPSNTIDVLITCEDPPEDIPPPVNLTLIPDNWEISLDWTQPWDLDEDDPAYLPRPDAYYGSQIVWSNDPDFHAVDEFGNALLHIVPKTHRNNFGTCLHLTPNIMYYYWVRNVGQSGELSSFYPSDLDQGVAGTCTRDMLRYYQLMDDWLIMQGTTTTTPAPTTTP